MNAQFLAHSFYALIMSWPVAPPEPVVIDADTLFGLCTDYDRVADTAACLGFVKGIANVLASGEAVHGRKACLVETAKDEELVAIVRAYLSDAGERGGDPAATLVAAALADAYPCKR